MQQTLRVGLTGGIGSGKTTVCNLFASLNVPIIDADIIAKQIVEPDNEGLIQVTEEFGKNILTIDGTLDRKKLRELVFNDEQKLQRLNSILHPLVYKSIEQQTTRIQYPYCIIAIPLLFETNGRQYVDRVLFIDSSNELQIERTMQRDSVTRNQVESIIASQMPRSEKLKLADDVIDNSFSIEHLNIEVIKLDKLYRSLSQTNS